MTDRPEPGDLRTMAPKIRRILAPNPSPMTHWGTNSYLIGQSAVAIVDPGPDDDRHLDRLLAAIGEATVSAILITHAHRDHSALAPRIATQVSAPVLAFGPPEAGRSAVMSRLAATGRAGGGEGVDACFRPDGTLSDGETLEVDGLTIEAIHTPGHFPGHLSFSVGDVLLSGDHIMEWSTTLISPPEGDVAAFLSSCTRLLERSETLYLPGHGGPVEDPGFRVEVLMRHRKEREAQILAALKDGPANSDEIAALVYRDIPPSLLPAAARNVLAHLVDLTERGMAASDPELAWDARFRRL